MAKQRQAKPNDISVIKCIKDKNKNIIVQTRTLRIDGERILMSLIENKEKLQETQQSLPQMKIEKTSKEYNG